MFKINAEPTFDATLTIIGQGREQVLKLTYRHFTREEYGDKLKAMADGQLDAADCILQLVDKWNADGPLDRDTIKRLCSVQPGADWAIITGYGDALTVARKGN